MSIRLKVAFYTLGCKVNQNETGALQQLFCENGFALARDDEMADVYIVNSCTVTAGGDKKSRQWLRRAKRENPEAVTVLTGCFPQAFPAQAELAGEADIITGAKQRRHILDDVLQFLQTKQRIVNIAPHEKGDLFEDLPLENLSGHTRAFLKIEDGCNRRCAYCVIPRARGNVRSRSEASILGALAALAKNGHAEVVFSGINLSSYGIDTGTNLAEIVERAASVEGIARIRLGSLEPDLLDDVTIQRLTNVEALCPQFHLALQSGCDATLRRMRRVYTTAQFTHVAAEIRRRCPSATLTTDVIVGFPGETEEEFAQSLAFVQGMRFLKVHVFPFSRRPGTPANEMPMQVAEPVKAARGKALQMAADAVRAEIIAEMEGMRATVLLETAVSETVFTGYTAEYVPVAVHITPQTVHSKAGDIVPVTLGRFDGARCAAELLTL